MIHGGTIEKYWREKAQMNAKDVNQSGAAAISQQELDRLRLETAHLLVNVCNNHCTSERTIPIKPKKWWQWWK